jgi:hypothetical protein
MLISSEDWWAALLTRHNLSKPDGRPVFRYRITKDEFENATRIIQTHASTLSSGYGKPALAALFICYCSEFYKREINTTARIWDPLLRPVGVTMLSSKVDEVIEPGLKYLGLKVVRGGGQARRRREWLLTLTLQAGLPVKLLVRPDGTWLGDYLTAVLTATFRVASLSENEALRVAYEFQGLLQASYVDADFFALVADLALVLRSFRDRAPVEISRGSALVDWLNQSTPAWRDELPMVLGDDAAARAIEGLVRNAQIGAADEVARGKFEAIRGLGFRDGEWYPTVRLEISGTHSLQSADPSRGRLELRPVGALARFVGGVAAIAMPPASKKSEWVLQRTLAKPLIDGFPLNEDIAFEFQGGPLATPLAIQPNKGQAIRGEVLVFEPTANTNLSSGAALLGSGSIASPALSLLILVPNDARIQAVNKEEPCEIVERGPFGSGHKVYEVRDSVYVELGLSGSRYRIDPSTEPRSRQLKLASSRTQGWESLDRSITICETPLDLRLMDGVATIKPKVNQVEWRAENKGPWQCALTNPPKQGSVRLRWRDSEVNVTLDVISAFIVPPTLRLVAKHDGNCVKLTYAKNLGVTFVPNPMDMTIRESDVYEFQEKSKTKIHAELRFHDSTLSVTIQIRPTRSMFVDQDGRALSEGTYRLWELENCEAVSARQGEILRLKLISKDKIEGANEQLIRFDGHQPCLPFAKVKGIMEKMRSSQGDLDSAIQISFESNDRNRLNIVEFGRSLTRYHGGVEFNYVEAAERGQVAVFRSLIQPAQELTATEAKGFEINGVAAVFPPSELKFPALVYVRNGERILTRPLLLGASESSIDANTLASVLSIQSPSQRVARLRDWYEGQPVSEAGRQVATIVASLRGLPALTLDILRYAPAKVMVAALLQSEEQEAAIWSLENQLPFSWLLCPAAAWQSAIEEFGWGLFQSLEVLGPALAAQTAKDAVQRRIRFLIQREPCLDYLFDYLPSVPWSLSLPSPNDITEAKLRLQGALKDKDFQQGGQELDGRTMQYMTHLVELAALTTVQENPTMKPEERFLVWQLRQNFPQEFESVFGRTLLDHRNKVNG